MTAYKIHAANGYATATWIPVPGRHYVQVTDELTGRSRRIYCGPDEAKAMAAWDRAKRIADSKDCG